MTTTAPAGATLRALADRVGIIAEYRDQTGRETRTTSDETRVALLAAMGIDASSEDRAQRALDEMTERERDELLEPVRVLVLPDGVQGIDVALGGAGSSAIEWSLELREEGGKVHQANGRAVPGADGHVHVTIPARPETGYHQLRATIRASGGERTAEQSLIVVPPSCPSAEDVLNGRRVFGITANLYTVRSARNWGVGDLGDLTALLRWGKSVGAEFLGVNPLHALRNSGGDVSPYSPVSRLFRNPIYIDVEAVPGYAQSSAVREIVTSRQFRDELARVRASTRVDYERVMALKTPVLRALHGAHLRGPRSRNADWTQWLEEQGEALESFATFVALSEHLGRDGDGGAGSWHDWPGEYRDSQSKVVQRFRELHDDEIDFHRWLQFVINQQLAAAAKSAREAGMSIGLYQDLAIGTSPDGGDLWTYPHLFTGDASIGAPPDPYSATGQNWGLPPIDPRALKRQRYEYWIALIRSSLRHGGALRIDHVMGLFRQFWIPAGKSGSDGAYVRFPSEDLLGILALEATRAGALVVGEDLGTVPDDVPPAMRRWHLLSSKVLYFERGDHGTFKPASSYDRDALATANTHDMPTIEGFWRARDVELRRDVGLIASDDEAAQARNDREGEKRALLERLTSDGILDPDRAAELARDDAPPSARVALRGAVHEFLCRTPSSLVGLSLDDIVGEGEPVNVPGVGHDRFPSWTRRLTMPLEELTTNPAVASALRCSRSDRADEHR